MQEYEDDLIDIMASALGIDSSLITINFTQNGDDTIVTYTIQGNYQGIVSSSAFLISYYQVMEQVNSTLYGLSQGSGGQTSIKLLHFTHVFFLRRSSPL